MGLYNPEDEQKNLNQLEHDQGAPDQLPAYDEPKDLSVQEGALLQKRTAENNAWYISAFHNGIGDWTKTDPDFNVATRLEGTKYISKPEYFVNSDNEEEIQAGMKQFNEDEEYGQLAARAPSTAFWSAMAWGGIDPMLAIPGVGTVKIARMAKTVSTARTAIQAGAMSAGAVAVSETILQAGNPERTAAEGAISIAAAGIVGAAFGGIAGRLLSKTESRLADDAVATKAAPSYKDRTIDDPASYKTAADDAVAGPDAPSYKDRTIDDPASYKTAADDAGAGAFAREERIAMLKRELAHEQKAADDAVANPATQKQSVADDAVADPTAREKLSVMLKREADTVSDAAAPNYRNSAIDNASPYSATHEQKATAAREERIAMLKRELAHEQEAADASKYKGKGGTVDALKKLYSAEQEAADASYKGGTVDALKKLYSTEQEAADDAASSLVARKQSMIEVKAILDITNEHTPPPTSKELAARKDPDSYVSMEERIAASDNVMADGSEIKDPINPNEVNMVSEEELAEALAPIGTDAKLLDVNTQSANAAYMTYDVRIKGLPTWVVKYMTIPHVSNVSIEGLVDASPIVRDFTTRVGYMHIGLEDSAGRQATAPISLESRMHADMLVGLDFNKDMRDAYLRYLKVNPDDMTAQVQRTYAQGVRYKKFNEYVMDAMNDGDRHSIREVENMAKYSRNVVDKVYKDMQNVGLIDKDQAPFKNWFKIVYDMKAILADRIGAENALVKIYVRMRRAVVSYTDDAGRKKNANAIYDTNTKQIDWQPRDGEKLVSVKVEGNIDIQEASQLASESVDNILQMGDKNLALGDIDRLSFTKGTDSKQPRKVIMNNAAYEIMKPYLVKDFNKVMHMYLASASRAINYKKMLDDIGAESLQDVRLRIRDTYKMQVNKIRNFKEATKEQIKAMPKAEQASFITKEKKLAMIKKLGRQALKSEALFNDIAAISLGQFKKRTVADGFWRSINQYNVIRLYGSIVISAVGDPLASVIKNGLPRTVMHGWLSGVKQFVTRTSKLKQQDYRNALTAIQNEIDDLQAFMMNPDLTPHGTGPIERVGQIGGNLSMKVTGMTAWNQIWQRASHRLAEYNILSYARNPTPRGVSYLKEIGIDEDAVKAILKMQEKYGVEVRGTHISNSHMWSDRQAADIFNNAIRVEVHKSPIITEVLDMPRFFQRSEMRKSMALGKGFSFAAINKITISALSRHDSQAIQGIVFMTMAGMVVQLLQDKAAGRISNYTAKEWLIRGLDKSGVGSMLLDPAFQVQRAISSKEQFGGQAWINEPTDYILGPSASIINPIYRAIVSKMAGKPVDAKTWNQLKLLIPYQNIWWLKKGIRNNFK